jgi:transcriptional regulator with XRE-family HTH domain
MKNQNSKGVKSPAANRSLMPLAMLAIAAVFREAREQRGLSFKKFEKLSSVSRQTLAEIECQEYFPKGETIARVAEGLGFSFGEFGVKVDVWMTRQPRRCRECRYSCMDEGRLKWLNSHRQCTRPSQTSPAAPAIPPVAA